MKTILKLIISFGLLLNLNAQSSEKISLKLNSFNNTKNALKLDQKLRINKGLYMDVVPQFGNQFISRIEAQKVRLNLNEFYEDFDFGFNMGFNFKLKEQLNLKAIYNIGMLKFDESIVGKVNSCLVKLTIDYVF